MRFNDLRKRSFTLIEILIVLTLISILATILIIIIKPTEILKKARDNQRIVQLQNIDKLIQLMSVNNFNFNELNYASSNIVYLSLQDNNSNCSSYQLPSLPSGWSYRCSVTPTNIDGTGWIPIPFNSNPLINLDKLPLDPINKPPYYYSFVVGGSYKLSAKPEVNFLLPIKDNGLDPTLIEKGSNLKLPTFQSGLVAYWSFDEGTGTIAYDLSGNNNNGILYNGPQWTMGKLGGALSFDGVNDYVYRNTFLGTPSSYLTICFWIKTSILNAFMLQLNRSSANYFNELIFRITEGKLQFWDYSNQYGFSELQTSVTSINDGNWNFVCFVKYSTIGKYYINGNFDSQIMAVTDVIYGSNNFAIGINYRNNNLFFNGLIDEVRIYNRALSSEEIKAIYEATK